MSHPPPTFRPPLRAEMPAEEVISRELAPGEQLVWAGRPQFGLRFGAADWFWFLFFVLMLAAACASAFGHGVVAAVFGCGLGVLTAYVVVNGLLLGPRRRQWTWYGLTSQRVVIVSARAGGVRVQSIFLALIGEARLTERPDGSGQVTFGKQKPAPAPWDEWTSDNPQFVLLDLGPEARTVFDLIRDIQRANLLFNPEGATE